MTKFLTSSSSPATQTLSSLYQRHLSRRAVVVSMLGLVLAGCGAAPSGGDTQIPSSKVTPTPPPSAPTSLPTIPSDNSVTPGSTPNPGRTYIVFKNHQGNVNAVAWSPDGRYIASAANDAQVLVWNAATGTPILAYKGHKAAVLTLAWSPDGSSIVSGGGTYSDKGEHSVHIWKALTGKDLLSYDEHTGIITVVAWSHDGLHIASASGAETSVRVWGTQNGKTVTTYTGNDGPVAALAWSPDSKSIVSGVNALLSGITRRTVKIWKSLSGDEILTYKSQGANAITWSPDGKLIASTQSDKIQIWDAVTGVNRSVLQSGNSAVLTLAWSPDGRYLASGGGSTQSVGTDNIAQVWNVATGQVLTTYRSHQAPVSSVSWSPDGTRIVSGSWDSVVRIWQSM